MIGRTTAFLVLIACVCAACRNAAPPRANESLSAADAREAAYRANNRGVLLMEQSSYADAATAFRSALATDPAIRLARINLAIALFYAGQPEAAAREAAQARQDDPEAPQPAYLLGLIARGENQPQAAAAAFMRVLALDPADAGARLNLAMVRLEQGQYAEVVALCRAVLSDEPYNATAAYNLALALNRAGDRADGARAVRQFEQLRNAPYAITYSQSYLEQGRYAEAIASTGAEQDLVNPQDPPVMFADATATLLPGAPTAGSVTLADIDGDGDLDLLTAGPAVAPSVRLFRNSGTQLVDATPGLGSAVAAGATGIVAADVNNDGRIDLLVLTGSGPRLFAQQEDNRFRDVTPAVFSTARTRLPGAAALADVDHDGDLDVLAGGRLFRNNGNGTFADITGPSRLRLPPAAAAVVPIDFDNRRDIDLLTSVYGARPALFRNLRTGAFEDVAADAGLPAVTDATAVAVGDVNKDGFTDAFFGRASAPGIWALSDGRGRYRTTDATAATAGARAAQLLDYDNDGLPDLIVAASDGLRLFRNLGREWRQEDDAVRASRHPPAPDGVVPSLASGDLDGDGDTDLVMTDQSGTVRVLRNDAHTPNRSLRVALSGRASNRNGVGAKIELRAGSLYQRIETIAATPAPAPADVVLGLGRHAAVDSVRVLWPSGLVQSEATQAPGTAATFTVTEPDRKPSSCPFLYTWDGERFTFVTDFMGGGEMGYLESPGVRNVPDPDEYVRITDRQLHERRGRYELRVTNELEEVLFVDDLKLLAVTHPAATEVFPDEGLRVRPSPFTLYAVRGVQPLAGAVDDAGRDLLPDLAEVDRRHAGGFPVEAVRGYAKPHTITMRMPPRPSVTHGRTVLLMTGWTDYAFSTDNVAASQAGLTLTPPVLQVRDTDGTWRTVNADVGVPIGRPQTIVLDITDHATGPIRLLTSMRIYWDRIAVAVADPGASPVVTMVLPALQTDLRWRGFSAPVSPDGREPYGYDYARVSPASPWKEMPGRYTREGDVAELLRSRDDRFVISRPGDEIALSFDASRLGPVPDGMRRTFLLYSAGYSKEMDLYSASPDVVPPIPFRAMPRYPYAWPVHYPHEADLDRFHTRRVTRPLPALDARATER